MKFADQGAVVDMLKVMCQPPETQRAIAERLGFSQSFIGDVMLGRADVSEKLAAALGYERRTIFVKIDD